MKKLLIVDDEEDLVKILAVQLARSGYEIVSAADSDKAVELLESHRPDLILLDYIIAGKSGGDLCRWIKERQEFKNTPVLFMTASPQLVTPAHMQETGASGCLVKPFHFAELMAKIKQHL